MATIKSYTNLSQSRKLAKILPIECADMFYDGIRDINTNKYHIPHDSDPTVGKGYEGECPTDCVGTLFLPCWSLAALLDYLSANFRIDIKYLDTEWELNCRVQVVYKKELIDACYEMILKLYEQKLL